MAEDGQRWLASVAKSNLKLSVGDTVVVGLDESAFTQGSALVYGVPMLFMIALAAIATALGLSDAPVAAAAFFGLVSGFLLVRFYSKRVASQHHFKPVILRRVIPISQ